MTTDVLAGLMILGQEESQRCPDKLRAGSQSQDSPMAARPAWMTIPRARHYMRYALAAYGWPYYLLPSRRLMSSMWRVYHVSRYAVVFTCDSCTGRYC